MAPNRKKKKAVSNPARGFATTSQPSKSKPKSIGTERNHDDELEDTRSNTNSQIEVLSENQAKTQLDPKQMSASEFEEYLEDMDLQNMIDSDFQRCKQKVSRQLTRLEIERRQLREQAHKLSAYSWLSNKIVDRIFEQPSTQDRDNRNHLSHIPIDSLDFVLKLWMVKAVVLALELPDADRAIEHLIILAAQKPITYVADYIWGLPEVLEWYATYGNQKIFASFGYDRTIIATGRDDVQGFSQSVKTHEAFDLMLDVIGHREAASLSIKAALLSRPDLIVLTHADIQSIEFVPHGANTTSPSSPTALPEAKPNLIEEYGDDEDFSALSSIDSDDNDPVHLHDNYLKLRSHLFRLDSQIGRSRHPPTDLKLQKNKLQKRIEMIQRDVLFDTDEAESAWQHRLKELRIETNRAKQQNIPVSRARSTNSPPLDNFATAADDDDDDVLGAIFDQNEDNQTAQHVSVTPTTIQVIDFGNWTGIDPRKLLEESCDGVDKQCRIAFGKLSTGSYSVRLTMEVNWSTKRLITKQALLALPNGLVHTHTICKFSLEMASVATANLQQAESYLSTIMLFLLIESGHVDYKLHKRLPTVWRELYDDQCQACRSLIIAADKDDLRNLRRTIREVQDSLNVVNDLPVYTQEKSATGEGLPIRRPKHVLRFSTQDAEAAWNARVSSSAYQTMLSLREQLPVFKYKEAILQAIDTNQVIIVCADTGAGKSTQVPTFVLEHELQRGHDCRLLVTQPRRISAVSLARRISRELGEHSNALGTDQSLVGYAIRLESKISKSTRITLATTGVLLRMIEASPQLEDLDYLVLDEVHERSMEVDLLLIVLKQLQKRRNNLRIILMSATVNAQKFSTYFEGAVVIDVPGRTFPVEVHYLEDAIEHTMSMQKNNDDETLESGEYDGSSDREENDVTKLIDPERYSIATRSKLSQMDEYRISYGLIASLTEAIATREEYVRYSSAILIFVPGIGEIRRVHRALLARDTFCSNWIFHLLHSSFSTQDLENAFALPPSGHRKIVIATNIAETGITIPDVTAVIDTCKEKVMRFDERRQLSRLTEGFISRSSARQRRGRAARVQNGLCFHLVTRHRFENLMNEEHVPEMLRLSLQDSILRLKTCGLGSVEETLATAIDPPNSKNVRRAVTKLKDAGALSISEDLTNLGKIIARLPLEVTLAKLAAYGIVFHCLDATLTIIAALSTKSVFLPEYHEQQLRARHTFAGSDSDLITTYNVYQGWRKAKAAGVVHQYCKKYRLSDQNLTAIGEQKTQLLVYLVDAGLVQLSREEKIALDRSRTVGVHKPLFDVPSRFSFNENDDMLNCIIALAFYPKILVREGKQWRNIFSNQQMNLMPNSVNRIVEKPPKWLCYYEAVQTRSGSLNVLETSKIPEVAIASLLGSAEFKYFAGVVILDNGKMRFSLRQWTQLGAIKTLRESLSGVLERYWQAPGLAMSTTDQAWIQLFAEMVTEQRP